MAEAIENEEVKVEAPVEPAPAHPLDRMFAEEEKALVANENPTEVSETSALETPEPIKEPGEAPEPIKEPPPADVIPDEAAKAHEEQPDERKGIYKELRELRRELRERDKRLKELEEAQAKPAAPVTEYAPEEPDQVTVLTQKTEALERSLIATQEATRQQAVLGTIKSQEEAFKTDHPDYHDATAHLARVQRSEYELSGMLDNQAARLMAANPDGVSDWYENQTHLLDGKPFATEREAAEDLAFRMMLDSDRQRLTANVLAKGRNVAQVAYDLAKARGYTPKTQEPPPEPAPNVAQERVRQAIRAESAGKSLSGMVTQGSPANKKITTRAQLMSMDSEEREVFILEQDRLNPEWDKNLV